MAQKLIDIEMKTSVRQKQAKIETTMTCSKIERYNQQMIP